MNILIPNNWLKDFLSTNATPKEFADSMSLTSVSIERMEEVEDDIVFDIEVTTNRPDLMSIEGIAREASAVLPQAGYSSKYKPHAAAPKPQTSESSPMLTIKNDKELVNRVMAVVMEIELGPSPEFIQKRLERTGIRSINNVVDTTNYIMREVGHPSHVFDYDRLKNHTLIIRKSKKGEKIQTLDEKEYTLAGGDIVADDGTGEIIDLLGVMGTNNSVVTDTTSRIVLFIDNLNPPVLRKTSMQLGIRTEAAVLNEKGVDSELVLPTFMRGIELLEKYAKGKIISEIIDIYPNKPTKKEITVTQEQINTLIGIEISPITITSILTNLGFEVSPKERTYIVKIPSVRNADMEIAEDIIEEIARVYGYHKIPNHLPQLHSQEYYHQEHDQFYWIAKIKDAMKFWGFNETYTYSMIAEEMFDGPIEKAIQLKNPLDTDHAFLRNTLIPSLLAVSVQNKNIENQQLFEIANVYHKTEKGAPLETLHFACLITGSGATFYKMKGLVEQILKILGIEKFEFSTNEESISGANISVFGKHVGTIEIDDSQVFFELDLYPILSHASSKKKYIESSKFPPIIEDITVEIGNQYTFNEVASALKKVNSLISDVEFLNSYKQNKTFRIIYKSLEKNLTKTDISPIKEEVEKLFKETFKAKIG